ASPRPPPATGASATLAGDDAVPVGTGARKHGDERAGRAGIGRCFEAEPAADARPHLAPTEGVAVDHVEGFVETDPSGVEKSSWATYVRNGRTKGVRLEDKRWQLLRTRSASGTTRTPRLQPASTPRRFRTAR